VSAEAHENPKELQKLSSQGFKYLFLMQASMMWQRKRLDK